MIFFYYNTITVGNNAKKKHHKRMIKNLKKEKNDRTVSRYYNSSKYRTRSKCDHCSRWCQNETTPWSWFEGLQVLFGVNGSIHFNSIYAWTIVNPKVNNSYWLAYIGEKVDDANKNGNQSGNQSEKDLFDAACTSENFNTNFQGTLRYVMGRAISGTAIDISFGNETLLDANFDYRKILGQDDNMGQILTDYISEKVLNNNEDDLLKTALNGRSEKTNPSKIKITSKCLGVDILFLHDYWGNDIRLVEYRGKRLYGTCYGYFGLGCKFNLGTKIEDDSLPLKDEKFIEKYTQEMINKYIPRIKFGTNIITPYGISIDVNCIVNLRSNFSEKYAFHDTAFFSNFNEEFDNIKKQWGLNDIKKPKMSKFIKPFVNKFFTHDIQFNVMIGYDFYPLLKGKFLEYDEDQYDEID